MELLVCPIDRARFRHPGDRPSSFRPGDIITGKPDGWHWSANERRRFFIVRVPDHWFPNEREWRKVWSPQIEYTYTDKGEREEEELRRTRYFFRIDHLSKRDRERVLSRKVDGGVETTALFPRTHLIDKEALEPRERPRERPRGR